MFLGRLQALRNPVVSTRLLSGRGWQVWRRHAHSADPARKSWLLKRAIVLEDASKPASLRDTPLISAACGSVPARRAFSTFFANTTSLQ